MVLTSCEEFLSEPPVKSSNVVIETTEDLDNLLNYYSKFYTTRDIASAYGTDNNDIPLGWYDMDRGGFSSYISFFLNSVEDIKESSFSPWKEEYGKIAYANIVLENLDKVTGTEAEKEELKREAHFIRAYSNFTLATIYCLPYSEENKDTPGLPRKTSMRYDQSLERQNVEETFEFIESDLQEALKTTKPRGDLWRFSLPAVNAFAARLYLYKHEYDKALSYATAALDDHNSIVYTNDMVEPQRDYFTYYVDEDLDTIEVNIQRPAIFWTRVGVPMHFDELYYARYLRLTQRFVPSQELLDLFDASDMRRGYIIEHFSLFYTDNPDFAAWSYFNYSQFALQGPTTTEMILIRAECLARQGAINDAMNELETLRQYRIEETAYTTLPIPGSIVETLNLIVKERRMENPFVWRRYDIKRLNSDPENIVPKIEITRQFYPYVNGNVQYDEPLVEYKMTYDDKRWATPIPSTEIILSKGEIKQNEY